MKMAMLTDIFYCDYDGRSIQSSVSTIPAIIQPFLASYLSLFRNVYAIEFARFRYEECVITIRRVVDFGNYPYKVIIEYKKNYERFKA